MQQIREQRQGHISLLLQLPSSCRCSSGGLCNLCAHFELGSGEGQCADSVCAHVGGREGEGRWLQQLVSLPLDGEVGRQVPCCASAVLCSPTDRAWSSSVTARRLCVGAEPDFKCK